MACFPAGNETQFSFLGHFFLFDCIVFLEMPRPLFKFIHIHSQTQTKVYNPVKIGGSLSLSKLMMNSRFSYLL